MQWFLAKVGPVTTINPCKLCIMLNKKVMKIVELLMISLLILLPFQQYIFRLEPGKVDSGKGKCPYDPKLNSVSALISKYLFSLLSLAQALLSGPLTVKLSRFPVLSRQPRSQRGVPHKKRYTGLSTAPPLGLIDFR